MVTLTAEEKQVIREQNFGIITDDQIQILADEFHEETDGTFYSYDHIREVVRGMGFPTDLFADIFMRMFDRNPPGQNFEAHSGEITLEKWIYAICHITSTSPAVRAELIFDIFNVRDREDDIKARAAEFQAFEAGQPLPPVDPKTRAYIELDDVARILEEFLVLFKKDDRFRDRYYTELRHEVARAQGIPLDDEKRMKKLDDFCLMHELSKRLWRNCGKEISEPLYLVDFLILQQHAPADFTVLEFFYDSLREVFHS